MNDMMSRLKDVAAQTQKLRLSAPPQNVSRVRGLSENLSEALVRMIRALSSSPEAIPSLRIARFVTAAEGANQNMIRLTSLRGQNQEEDADLDAAEEDLADVVGILTAAAESARLDVLSSIKSDLSATRDLINAWNMPAVTQTAAADPERNSRAQTRRDLVVVGPAARRTHALPRSRLFHWLKRHFETRYLKVYR